MQKAHDSSKNSFWRNYPNISTPITQEELNRVETTVDVIDDRVVTFDTTKANQTDMLQTISNISFNRTTGIFTVTRYNGTSFTIDTDLEKIAVNFDYDDNPSSPHYQNLILTLIDGTVKYIDLSALITQYEFVDSAFLHFSVDATGKVTATIINGSITEDKLEPNFLANCRTEVSKATQQADNANEFRKDAEAWSTGKRDGVDVRPDDETYNNNSKYYSVHAREEAEAWSIGKRSGIPVPPTDETYNNNAKYWNQKTNEDGQAWTEGKRNNVPVPSTDPTYQNNAKFYSQHAREEAEAWSVGERGGVPVSSDDETYENNSKFYAEVSESYSDDAKDYRDEAAETLQTIRDVTAETIFSINFNTGNLEYTNDAAYTFTINQNTGNLEWEVVS